MTMAVCPSGWPASTCCNLSIFVKQTLRSRNLHSLMLRHARFGVPKGPRMIKAIKSAIEKITPAGENPFWSWLTIVALGLFVANVFWFR